MDKELLPCPFCGGADTHDADCYIQMLVEYVERNLFLGPDDENKLEEAWNTRAERTCRNVAEQGVLFECSVCGAKTVDAVGNYTQEYCAACGRKVQDAD